MPSLFSNKRLIFLLVSTIVMVTVVGLTMKERPHPTWPEQFVRDTVGFFQSTVSRPTHYMTGWIGNVNDIRQVYSENQKLKQNLQDNAKLMAKIRELEIDNESLRSALDIESSLSDYQLRSAEVINRSPDRWYQQITINRGQKHGISPNMAVLNSEGFFIGRITSVTQYYSTVELISDPNRTIQISAVVQGESPIYGVIDGYDVEQNGLYLSMIHKNAELEEGQTVITSGRGGIFPKGLYVGKVKEVIDDEFGLTQVAIVESAANLQQLDHVLVVERSMLSEDEFEENEGNQIGEDEAETEIEGGTD